MNMLKPDVELAERKGVSDAPRPCRNCGHESHYGETCFAEVWEELLCDCEEYEAETAEDILEREGRI